VVGATVSCGPSGSSDTDDEHAPANTASVVATQMTLRLGTNLFFAIIVSLSMCGFVPQVAGA
jgi:hypothetical protein